MSQFLSYNYRTGYTKLLNGSKNLNKNCSAFLRFTVSRYVSHTNKKLCEADRQNVYQNRQFIPFLERVDVRRSEARRSLLVQVQSAQSYKELHTYCSLFGNVRQMLHYSNGVEPLHFILVEFAKESEVTNLIKKSTHLEENLGVPASSHFLWFRANKKQGKLKQNKSLVLGIEDGTRITGDQEMIDNLEKCDNISHQMESLYSSSMLNDLGTRLRYLTSLQIEQMVSGMFPNAVAYPFGSSVNGYGKMGCDLDLVLRLVEKTDNEDSRLIFHCKASSGSERTISQRHMEVISDMIHLFLPGCAQVRRILQARVPIIKFHQQLTDIECDLSMGNMSGVHMSDYLYLMGELDPRVRPLVFTVRKWASAVGLTNSSPGRWISNFSLTLLVLAFLQRPLSGNAVLPSLNTLIKLAGPSDKYVTEDGINCTFLRDLTRYKENTKNSDPLESLLREFFEYYSQFDFSSKAVCLNEAVAITKPEHSPMYIVNPLEKGLNVSKNVSQEEVDRFRNEVRNAAWLLESEENNRENWGLLTLFDKKPSVRLPTAGIKPGRLVNVSTLFEQQDITYKNDDIRREVSNIRRTNRERTKILRDNFQHQKSGR